MTEPEDLAAVLRDNPDWFTKVEVLECDCVKPLPTIAVIYAGPDDSLILFIPSSRVLYSGDDKTSDREMARQRDRAFTIPDTLGPTWAPQLTNCRRCNSGYLLRPMVRGVNPARLTAPTNISLT